LAICSARCWISHTQLSRGFHSAIMKEIYRKSCRNSILWFHPLFNLPSTVVLHTIITSFQTVIIFHYTVNVKRIFFNCSWWKKQYYNCCKQINIFTKIMCLSFIHDANCVLEDIRRYNSKAENLRKIFSCDAATIVKKWITKKLSLSSL